jgi:hypothetical protein
MHCTAQDEPRIDVRCSLSLVPSVQLRNSYSSYRNSYRATLPRTSPSQLKSKAAGKLSVQFSPLTSPPQFYCSTTRPPFRQVNLTSSSLTIPLQRPQIFRQVHRRAYHVEVWPRLVETILHQTFFSSATAHLSLSQRFERYFPGTFTCFMCVAVLTPVRGAGIITYLPIRATSGIYRGMQV